MPLFPLTTTGRAGALQAAREAGYTLRLLSGRWHVDAASPGEADACQAMIDAFDDLAAVKREKRLEIDRELQRRLTQRLSLARAITIGGAGIKLLAKYATPPVSEWNAEDRALLAGQLESFERANSILLSAIGLETAVNAGTLASVRALDVADDEYWPE